MIVAYEIVAEGTGWSICREPGTSNLILQVKGAEFVARPGNVEVHLPAEFATELLRQKRALMAVQNCTTPPALPG